MSERLRFPSGGTDQIMWRPERREPRPGRPRGRSSATRGGGWGLRTIERLEARGLLTVTINPITPIAEIPFNDQVPTFTSPPTGVTFTATIGWGDGSPPTTGAVQADSHGNLDISGSPTYPVPCPG